MCSLEVLKDVEAYISFSIMSFCFSWVYMLVHKTSPGALVNPLFFSLFSVAESHVLQLFAAFQSLSSFKPVDVMWRNWAKEFYLSCRTRIQIKTVDLRKKIFTGEAVLEG